MDNVGLYEEDYIPKLVGDAFSGLLTSLFAIAGALTGAVSGALAGTAADGGLIRGAGLGAVAGAVLSFEVLEASRGYWRSQPPHFLNTSSVVNLIEALLPGRFVEGRYVENQLPPAVLTGYYLQAGSVNVDVHVDVVPSGLSGDSLKELPCHVILDLNAVTHHICCTICLQDFEVSETARSLPKCSHTFHQECVDKWLQSHGSCPICRRHV